MWAWPVLLLVGAVMVVSLVVPRPRSTDRSPLSPSEVGYLAGGKRRALVTAVNELVATGILRVTRRGDVARRASTPPAGADVLERAIYRRAYAPVGAHDLLNTRNVQGGFAALHRGLAVRRLMVSTRRLVVVWVLVVVAVLTVLARAWSAVGAARSWLEVVIQLAFALCLAGTLLLFRGRTLAGSRALRRLRRQHSRPNRGPRTIAGTDEAENTGVTLALYGTLSATTGVLRHDLADLFSFGDRDLETAGDPGGFGGIRDSSRGAGGDGGDN